MNREMKDSNDSMLGLVPANWEISRLKFHCSIKNGSDPTSEGDIPVLGSGKDIVKYCGEYKEGPVILLGRKGTLDKPKYIEGKFWNVDTVMDAYAKVGTNPKYLYYIATIFDIPRYATTTAKPSMTQFDYYNMLVPAPPETEQADIVCYIDDKSNNINEAISRHRSIIQKLEEYRKAVITHAVTKGLNPVAEMLETDDKYFSVIPYDWELRRNKFVFRIKKDIAGRDGLTVLSITQKGIVPKDIESNEGQLAESYANYQLVETGDFAMNHMDLLTGWVDISKYSGVTSPDYRVFVLREPENHFAKYFLYVMQMCYLNRIFYSLGAGVSGFGRWRLQAPAFNDFKIPVPPKSEQIEIATYLDEKCAKVKGAIARQEEAITKLEEYRKSVIYNAVTGKIDCRIGE